MSSPALPRESEPPTSGRLRESPTRRRTWPKWLRTCRRRGAQESGVVLVLVAIMMTTIIGMAALAIDIGSFYKAQRQAQSAADAGALVGAQDLGSSPSSVTTDANSMVTTNYPGATATVTEPTSTTVKVTVNASTPSFFGQFLHLTSANVGASATAAEGASATCTGQNCYAIFAKDSTCSGTGVNFGGGGYHITGGIHSNGSINTGGGGSSYGPTTYGTGCNHSTGGGDSFTSGPTPESPINTWPIDYSTSYPACSGAACTGPHGTPSFCTYAAASYTFTSSPAAGIYCAYGTGTVSNPATYDGSVAFNNGGYNSASSPISASFICGTATQNAGSMYFQAYNYPTNKLIFYATGTGTAVSLGAGSANWTGDFFVPNGAISISAGSEETNFLEAQDVSITSGGITGDGPPDGSGSSSSGPAALTQ